jgi:hypothetical protein
MDFYIFNTGSHLIIVDFLLTDVRRAAPNKFSWFYHEKDNKVAEMPLSQALNLWQEFASVIGVLPYGGHDLDGVPLLPSLPTDKIDNWQFPTMFKAEMELKSEKFYVDNCTWEKSIVTKVPKVVKNPDGTSSILGEYIF